MIDTMSRLDCNTPQGQVYITAQMLCIKKLEVEWNCQVFPTRPESSADVDALFVKDGVVALVGEIKSRELSLNELKKFGSYLITHEKLVKVKNVAKSLAVPSVVVVSLLKDERIVWWRLSDSKGEFVAKFEERVTETKRTCNGGKIFRNNAYISLDEMQVI